MNLSEAVARIRPAVRLGKAYLVGGPPRAEIKLNQNESPFDLPSEIKRELIERYFAEPFNRYPLLQAEELTMELGAFLKWDPKGILVGNGSNELMATVMQVLISSGSKVVLPEPMFSFYSRLVELFEGDTCSVPPRDDFSFDTDSVVSAARDSDASLIVLATPNNPTGLAMSSQEVYSVLKAAQGFVLVDEAYIEFSSVPSALSLLDEFPNLLIIRTFSKAFGLAGLRVGYLLGRPAVVQEIMKARVPFMVDRLSELAALALLKRPLLLQERVSQMKRGTQWLYEALHRIPCVKTWVSDANFVLFKTPVDPEFLLDSLACRGVLVRSMSGYPDLKGYLRVNAGTKEENDTFIRMLTELLTT